MKSNNLTPQGKTKVVVALPVPMCANQVVNQTRKKVQDSKAIRAVCQVLLGNKGLLVRAGRVQALRPVDRPQVLQVLKPTASTVSRFTLD